MKKIYLNLKRFDIPRELGGINDLNKGCAWAKSIVSTINKLSGLDYTIFFPEAYVLPAVETAESVKIGCQSVHFDDVEAGGNFGAFTSFRTAKSMQALGVKATMIGHCEERRGKQILLDLGGGKGDINEILNREIICATKAGLDVLYCIGEKSDEQENRFEVLRRQLEVGLKDVDLSKVTIAYEPVWAIGVGKTPPGREYIQEIAQFIKSVFPLPVVYGGGLKEENAKMIGSIPEVDGGLIALTRFGKDFGFYLDDFRKIVEKYKEALNES
jgi:triosephosphate isomerase